MNANVIKKCSVFGCDSDSSRKRSIAFQMFPSMKHIALKWIKNLEHLIPSLLFDPVQKLVICEKHFERKFLLKPGTIAGDAYPTLFTPKEMTTGEPKNFEEGELQTTMDHSYCTLKNQGFLAENIPSNDADIISKKFIIDNVSNTTTEDINDVEHTNILTKTTKTYSKTQAKTGINNITNIQHNPVSLQKKNNNTIGNLKDSNGLPVFQMAPSTPKVTKQVSPAHFTVTIDPTTNKPILSKQEAKTNVYSNNNNTAIDLNNDTEMHYDDHTTTNSQQIQVTKQVSQPHFTVTIDPTTNKPILTKQGSKTNVYSNNNNTAIDLNNDTKMHYDDHTTTNSQQIQDTAKLTSVPRTTLKMAHPVTGTPGPRLKMVHPVTGTPGPRLKMVHPVTGTPGPRLKMVHPVTGTPGPRLKMVHPVTGTPGPRFKMVHPLTGTPGPKLKMVYPLKSIPITSNKMAHPLIIRVPESSKNLERKYKECLQQVKKLKRAINSKNNTIKRLKFNKKAWFDKLTKDVDNPLAKKFIWMQVRSSPKSSHGRRFTDEEKTICIYINKQSPECYRMLSKIFTLPSRPSLYKFLKSEMAPKNKDDSSPSNNNKDDSTPSNNNKDDATPSYLLI